MNLNLENKCIELDNIDITYDTVNQEPDLSTDIRTKIEDSESGSPLAGVFNSEANVKEQIKEQSVSNIKIGAQSAVKIARAIFLSLVILPSASIVLLLFSLSGTPSQLTHLLPYTTTDFSFKKLS